MPAAKPVPQPATAPGKIRTEGGREAGKGSARATKLKPAFASRKQPPNRDDFAAKLDPAAAKRFEGTRAWLGKLKGVTEDLHYYGASSGWGLRYMVEGLPLCALFVAGEHALAVLSLDGQTDEAIDWEDLSEATRHSRSLAQGSASNLWLDVPLDAKGHSDLRVLVKARAATLGRHVP